MNNGKYYLVGNTIYIDGFFYDLNNQPCNPQMVKLIIYNDKYIKIDEIILNDSHKIKNGHYRCPYKFDNVGQYVYEFYGEIDGMPSLKRELINIKFI